MAKAIWNGAVLAESSSCEIVEGNYYFPPNAVNREYLKESNTHTNCFWKGEASYYNLEVNGQVNQDGAWYYPEPKEKAKNIQNYVAFWHGVQVEA
ncbi:MAG: DUF427 domain-containing protein [Microcoleaceae cyanobacterium MO_207.B10]|nr:DUF427 domain-containing protein [Microcoleaceae cyanobacterium MO_207.B10]